VSESNRATREDPFVVWTTMREEVGHPAHALDVGGPTIKIEKSGDPAHYSYRSNRN
jgi:hypothetical protein